MFKLDGSEVSWLVYADWLEDQDKPGQHIRDSIEQEYHHFCFEIYDSGIDMVGSPTLADLIPGTHYAFLDSKNEMSGGFIHYLGGYPGCGWYPLNSRSLKDLNSEVGDASPGIERFSSGLLDRQL